MLNLTLRIVYIYSTLASVVLPIPAKFANMIRNQMTIQRN